ncbi:Vanin-like protein 1 [Eumeta japonica]|uniref:Vanin-like protein 1 n=1 Tax=Eumeta variegata TaxID=151549 RepID=A0A4C1UM63_EUMVA|nr:Vanin-like protein 1 [Eumeta japonica]
MQLLFILCLLSLTRRSEQLLPSGNTINSKLYYLQLMRLKQEVERKWPELVNNRKGVLVSLSNAARLNQIYVVINIEELMNCTVVLEGGNCPNNTDFRFNTNVVFVRNGAVIDRSKMNLFDDRLRIPALTPDLDYFETDFGVRLSHFICFNLMFQVPAVQTVLKLNVTDVIFSTMWFSEMPYLTAVQIQEDYAYAQNVNFLAAGANNVRVGSAASVMPGTDTTELLVERVPKIPGRVNWTYTGPEHDLPRTQDNLYQKRDTSVSVHVTRVLVLGYQEFKLSHNEVTCTFRIRLKFRGGAKDYTYRKYNSMGLRVERCAHAQFTRASMIQSNAAPSDSTLTSTTAPRASS